MCLVMGAVGLVIGSSRLKSLFFWLLVTLGALGTWFAVTAWQAASAV
jgi:hypothetical protein